MRQNSKKTILMIAAIAIVAIAAGDVYLITQANKGKELLESKKNAPENIPQETKEVINSVNSGNSDTSEVSQPAGIDQSGFGDLDSGIQQLDQDLNKL